MSSPTKTIDTVVTVEPSFYDRCIDHLKSIIEDLEMDNFNEEVIQDLPSVYYRKKLIRTAYNELVNGSHSKKLKPPSLVEIKQYCHKFISENNVLNKSADYIQDLDGMYFRKNVIRSVQREI